MKLLRFELDGARHAGVLTAGGIAPVAEVNARRGTSLPDSLLGIIELGDLEPLKDLTGIPLVPLVEVRPVLPYDVPPKIWCTMVMSPVSAPRWRVPKLCCTNTTVSGAVMRNVAPNTSAKTATESSD